jgi:hypothetical protein
MVLRKAEWFLNGKTGIGGNLEKDRDIEWKSQETDE